MATGKGPFNLALHDHLLSRGYRYVHVPADYHDDGDPENGPHLTGHDAYDAYSCDVEDVYIEHDGTAYHEVMDPVARLHSMMEAAP